jgi:hypothetical protein
MMHPPWMKAADYRAMAHLYSILGAIAGFPYGRIKIEEPNYKNTKLGHYLTGFNRPNPTFTLAPCTLAKNTT